MKRTFATVLLLAALGIFLKLAIKPPIVPPVGQQPASSTEGPSASPTADLEAQLLARYPNDRPLVERALNRYRHTALAVERTDGLRGLKLLDALDLEAIYLYEKYPTEFRRLRDSISDQSAADLLLHWREYFGLKRADETDRAVLISEISRLTPSQRRWAARYPAILPLLLAEPQGVAELCERLADDEPQLTGCLVVLNFISLERGAADLRAALRTLDHHPDIALEAFRLQGLEGFALVSLYGPVLEAVGDALPLDQTLVLLRVNTDYVDELLATQRPETVAAHLRHMAAVGLVDQAGGSPQALRLVVEHGPVGERALAQAGADAAEVVYGDFSDPMLRTQAVAALAEHGTMALATLDKYAADSSFREILRAHGPAIIPAIAQADATPETLAALQSKSKLSFSEALAKRVLLLSGESGQATIRTIERDGLDRALALSSTELHFYQFLPLYDLTHLGTVISHGQSPTGGEMAWALVDGCFVVADALSLLAVQPEGVAASEAARAEVRAAAKGAGRVATEQAAEATRRTVVRRAATEATEAATERVSRWWAVRAAGGTYQLLRRMPEALPRLSLAEITRLGSPMCSKAGLRLSTWAPVRFLKNGQEILRRIPPERGLKYVAAQAVQAGVGVVGFQKMEEHLASRRPATR
jgi:hypothetical protein